MSRKSSEGPSGFDALTEIDARLGELGRALRSALDAASSGQSKTTEWSSGDGSVQAGIQVRIGGIQSSQAKPSASPRRKETAKEPSKSVRTPIAEIEDGEDAWTLTVELPGVSVHEIEPKIGDGTLTVVTTGDRQYQVNAPLPDGLAETTPELRLTNGILEIRFQKGLQPE